MLNVISVRCRIWPISFYVLIVLAPAVCVLDVTETVESIRPELILKLLSVRMLCYD